MDPKTKDLFFDTPLNSGIYQEPSPEFTWKKESPLDPLYGPKKKYALLDSIDTDGMLLAAIINQAKDDSMPEALVFDRVSPVSMFNSLAFCYSDAYFFMASPNRADHYIQLLGLDVDEVRNKWRSQYNKWLASRGKEIAINIVDYMVKLSKIEKMSSTIRIDLIAFIKSTHMNYWSNVAGVDLNEITNQLLENLHYQPTLLSIADVNREFEAA